LHQLGRYFSSGLGCETLAAELELQLVAFIGSGVSGRSLPFRCIQHLLPCVVCQAAGKQASKQSTLRAMIVKLLPLLLLSLLTSWAAYPLGHSAA
jgi:hypothetical protein